MRQQSTHASSIVQDVVRRTISYGELCRLRHCLLIWSQAVTMTAKTILKSRCQDAIAAKAIWTQHRQRPTYVVIAGVLTPWEHHLRFSLLRCTLLLWQIKAAHAASAVQVGAVSAGWI